MKHSVGAAVCVSVLSPFQKMSPDRQNICCQIDNSNVLFKKNIKEILKYVLNKSEIDMLLILSINMNAFIFMQMFIQSSLGQFSC